MEKKQHLLLSEKLCIPFVTQIENNLFLELMHTLDCTYGQGEVTILPIESVANDEQWDIKTSDKSAPYKVETFSSGSSILQCCQTISGKLKGK